MNKKQKHRWGKVLKSAGANAKQFVGLKRASDGRVSSQSGSDQPEHQAHKRGIDPARKGRGLVTQDLKETRGNAGAYEQHIGTGGEPPQANPDVLPEMEIAAPSTPQLLMGEAVEHLQGRQKEVYFLTMREGKSLAETADILSLSKGTAQKYKERAIKFVEGYCRQAIQRGRV
jgi:DNA-directed RNA polymerase specialized sigma24 family protein